MKLPVRSVRFSERRPFTEREVRSWAHWLYRQRQRAMRPGTREQDWFVAKAQLVLPPWNFPAIHSWAPRRTMEQPAAAPRP